MADLDTSAEDRQRAVQEAVVFLKYRHYRKALASSLAARYPGVTIMSVRVSLHDDGEIQQTVDYRASRAVLLASGLATERMFETGHRFEATTELGCGFNLHESFDGAFAPGSWDLAIYTGHLPRDRGGRQFRQLSQKGLREVGKLLRKFQHEARGTA